MRGHHDDAGFGVGVDFLYQIESAAIGKADVAADHERAGDVARADPDRRVAAGLDPGDDSPAGAVAEMRATWERLGIGAVEMGAVLFHVEGESPVAADLFDFWIEMPPHGLVGTDDYLFGGLPGDRMQAPVKDSFSGLIYDYHKLRENSLSPAHAASLPPRTIAGIMPCWDNSARRGHEAHIAYGANPATFERWLLGLLETRVGGSYRHEIMINAWNEWAEKAIMEPSRQYGPAYLDALRRAL